MNINANYNNYKGLTLSPTATGNTVPAEDKTASTSSLDSADQVNLSREGLDKSRTDGETKGKTTATTPDASASGENNTAANLTREELQTLTKLKARDTEVRTHEQAHLAAAGKYARSAASFTTEKGPDGNAYAVGGEVNIDVAEESDPSETIKKMQTVRGAALAPAQPSSADRQIAAQASVKEAKARQELLNEQQDTLLGNLDQTAANSSKAAEDSANSLDRASYGGSGYAHLKIGLDQYLINGSSPPASTLSLLG